MRILRGLGAYVALAYAITWVGVAPLVAARAGLVPPVPASLHALGALGPVAAALLVTSRVDGPLARRRLLASAFRDRPPRPWLLVAVMSPFAPLALALPIAATFGAGAFTWAPLAAAATRPAWWADLLVASVLYGFGEEPGWRGFALPRLQARLPAWGATLVLAVIWALWHAPMFLYRFTFGGPAAVVGFFVSLLAGALWLTFLYNSTGGSVLATALWHAGWNVANLVAAPVSPALVATLNGLMMALGFGVLLAGPRRLVWPP